MGHSLEKSGARGKTPPAPGATGCKLLRPIAPGKNLDTIGGTADPLHYWAFGTESSALVALVPGYRVDYPPRDLGTASVFDPARPLISPRKKTNNPFDSFP